MIHRSRRWGLLVGLFVSLTVGRAQDAPKPIRALLVVGGCCHDYVKQKEMLKKGLEALAHVSIDIAYSPDTTTKARFEHYYRQEWAKGYDVIIHDECSSDVTDKDYVAAVLAPHVAGVPAVNLHCAMHSYRTDSDVWFRFCGIESRRHGPRKPIDLSVVDPRHPIMKGSGPWRTIDEELYNNIKVYDTVHKLVVGKQDVGGGKVDEAIVVWTNTFAKAKIFNVSLGHCNETVEDPRYLKIVARGLLWSCNKLNDEYLKSEE